MKQFVLAMIFTIILGVIVLFVIPTSIKLALAHFCLGFCIGTFSVWVATNAIKEEV